jgi:hypothetical protein
MSEPEKDFIGLLELSEELKQAGQEPPAPEGLIFEETPIEQVDHFESLETYAEANPVPEAPPEVAFETTPESSPESNPQPDSDFPITTDEASPSMDFATTPSSESEPNLNFLAPVDLNLAPENESTTPQDIAQEIAQGMPQTVLQESPTEEITETRTQPVTQQERLQAQTTSATQRIPSAVQAAVPAAFPFSLLIEGQLTPREKDKLLDIIEREAIGIRAIDLEPQLQANKILIPRVSEFTGIYIIQVLRETRAKIKFGPSDEIFAAQGTTEDTQPLWTPPSVPKAVPSDPSQPQHPADAIPVTTERSLPGLEHYTAIDTITASGTLQSFAVEAETTGDYQELLSALQRELKFKARRRGAAGVIHYRIQLTPLTSPSRYRLTVMGLAIRPR